MTTTEGGSNNDTFTSLVTTNHRDADEVDGAFPQRFFLVATAKISQALTSYTTGSNAQRIESTNGGNTNLVYVVRDVLTGSPTALVAKSAIAITAYLPLVVSFINYRCNTVILT